MNIPQLPLSDSSSMNSWNQDQQQNKKVLSNEISLGSNPNQKESIFKAGGDDLNIKKKSSDL